MKAHEYYRFAADVRRWRPFVAVVIAIVLTLPSMVGLLTEGLSVLVVLERLVEALVLVSVLVATLSGLVLHYARTHLRDQAAVGSSEADQE